MRLHSCIVLDLDHTLIYSVPKYESSIIEEIMSKRPLVYELENYYGFYRSNLDNFLYWCFNSFDYVVVWSAGNYQYVNEICKIIFDKYREPDLILTREDCYFTCIDNISILTKPLSTVLEIFADKEINIDLKNLFIVDDIEDNFIFNKSYGILIEPFDGKDDDELYSVIHKITNIRTYDNVT